MRALLIVLIVAVIYYAHRRRKGWWRRLTASAHSVVHPDSQKFTPVPELPCGPAAPPEYAVDTTGRGAAGTVVWGPRLPGITRGFVDARAGGDYIPRNRLREGFAGRPSGGAAAEAERFMSALEASPTPAEAGRLAAAATPLAQLTRRSAPAGPAGARACAVALADVAGDFDSAAAADSLTACERTGPGVAAATDRPAGRTRRTPAGLRLGLGSVRQDPRFQPGPQYWAAADYGPAPGTHAGGPTLGALATAALATPGSWDATYLRALGSAATDAEFAAALKPYEALETL